MENIQKVFSVGKTSRTSSLCRGHPEGLLCIGLHKTAFSVWKSFGRSSLYDRPLEGLLRIEEGLFCVEDLWKVFSLWNRFREYFLCSRPFENLLCVENIQERIIPIENLRKIFSLLKNFWCFSMYRRFL